MIWKNNQATLDDQGIMFEVERAMAKRPLRVREVEILLKVPDERSASESTELLHVITVHLCTVFVNVNWELLYQLRSARESCLQAM
jgi:hypothetical protein